MWHVNNKRINEAGRAVFDLMAHANGGFENFIATIEVRGDAAGGLKVLYGALQPKGKERAWEAIRRYEMPV